MNAIYEPQGRAQEYSLLAANLYTGCPHGCLYCYAPGALHRQRETFHADCGPRDGILEALSKDARNFRGDPRRVLLCFTCDPYPADLPVSHDVTRLAIQWLHRERLAVQVLTKGGTRACADFDLYGPNDAFATTLTWRTAEESLEMEPRAATPADRVAAIRTAKARGLQTWVSLEPVFEPTDALAWIDELQDCVDLFKVGTLNHSPLAKAIDWRAFGIAAVEKLAALGKAYWIKRDLAKHIADVPYRNTDTRTIRVPATPHV